MYDETNVTYRVGINWKDILIKIIMLILFVLLLLWLFPRADLDVFYDQVYTNNIKTMKEAARNYYTVDRLPANVGDQTSMTLKEMVDNKMIIRFTDKDGKVCDETSSGIEITKTSNNEYTMKVELNCGDQKDYILETIGCTTVCSNGTCQTIINNSNNSSNATIAGGSSNSGNTQTGGNDTVRDDTDWENITGSVKDDVYKVKVTYYQHKKPVTTTKTVYTCPSGYVKNGTKCIKTTTGATIDATPVYNPDQVVVTDAKFNYSGDYTVYADPIKTNVGTNYSCPTGYTLNGSYCIKYTDATEETGATTYTCPNGYTKNGSKCTKSYDATPSTGTGSYTCPSGTTLNGTKCVETKDATADTTYTCPTGYTKNGTSCYKVYEATSSTTYTCPSGYTKNGSKCTKSSTKTIDATASTSYGGWKSAGTKYYTSAAQAYTGDTSKLVYVGAVSGAVCGSPCGNKGVWYKYTYYTRSKDTTYSCPSGYSKNGTKCTKTVTDTIDATADTSYTCKEGGTRNGSKCTLTTNATSNTTYTCPSGYTKNGTKCTKTTDATYKPGATTYSCPNGATLNGTKCVETINATAHPGSTSYSCPTGYTYNENTKKCEYKISATATQRYEYSCPTGYTKSGEGEKTVCSKVTSGEKVYYCEDAGATLNGTKCIKTVAGGIKGYTCPTGYTLNGTKCTKKSTVTIDATATTKTSTSYKYKWSKSSSIAGWTFTGKTKVVEETYTAGQK